MLCFSIISLPLGFGFTASSENNIAPIIVMFFPILIVSYLCARFSLRARQLLFGKRTRVWDRVLCDTISSSILSILLTSSFPLAQIFHLATFSKETLLVAFSLLGTSLGTLCFLLSYKYSHKQISWTGLQILPAAKS